MSTAQERSPMGGPSAEAATPAHCIVIAPNASLSWRQAALFMLGISTVALGIGVAFASMGFWVILPFAGLELAALGAALYVSLRRNDDREVVTIDADRVQVEAGRVGAPDQRVRHEFLRAWARVELLPAGVPANRSRLRLGASGHFVEVGACLSESQRLSLATHLRKCLRGESHAASAVE